MFKTIIQILSISLLVLLLVSCEQQTDSKTEQNNDVQLIDQSSAEFVGSAVCGACHQDAFAQWQQSHHFQSMLEATSDSVLADFDEAQITAHNVKYRFYSKSNNSYWVNIQEEGEEEQDYQISYTFGYSPLQQYMVEMENGHVQVLNMAWDSRGETEGGQNWFHLRPDENISSDNIFHWRRHYQNWNSRCADCHSTGVQKNYDIATASYDTQWSEVNVACEACHGEGSRHVDLAQQEQLAEDDSGFVSATQASLAWTFSDSQPIASPVVLDQTRTDDIAMCGRCHSLRSGLSEHASGSNYHDEYRLQVVNDSSYFADGQILEETFVLGSFLQSKMHASGVTCANCHNPHTGSVLVEGNGLCLQCHAATTYETVDHHNHTMSTAGAECVSCHMPARTYMQVDPRRDHSFVVPNAELTNNLGVPNPCLTCHQDKDSEWLTANLENDFTNSLHWSVMRSTFINGDDSVLSDIKAYLQGTEPLMRKAALLASLNTIPSQQSFDIAKQQLESDEALLRRTGLTSMSSMPNVVRLSSALKLINDSNRSVRFEALSLIMPAYQELSDQQRTEVSTTLEEYRQSLLLNADSPEGQMAIAGLALAIRDFTVVEEAYHKALDIEPNFVPGLINFADFYRASNRDELGRELLQKALQIDSQNSGANFAYAMSLIRAQQKESALQYLQTASEQVDSSPYYHYVYAVGLNDLGQKEQAITVVTEALKVWPNDAGLLELSGQLQ